MEQRRPTLVLASASPARRRTLAAAGIDADVMVSGVDESAVDDPSPAGLCQTLARLKAEAVAARLVSEEVVAGAISGAAGRDTEPTLAEHDVIVLGCDSVLEFGGRILGKPGGRADAVERWRRMRGGTGVLHTGHCLIQLRNGKRAEAVSGTVVHFADLTDDEIAAYVASGEPLEVAGAFTIDGLGGPFVDSIEGDPGTVIGLSLPLLRRMLAGLGVSITDLWRAGLNRRAGPG